MTRIHFRVVAAAAMLLAVPAMATAQQPATITGQVSTATGTPVPLAQLLIEGLNIGTQTGSDGRYSLTVPAAQATGQQANIVVRRIGYQQASATVALSPGAITQNFTLSPTAVQLTGVIVTALGVEREKSQLGTAQQTVSADELTQTHSQSVINQLGGKVSGVQVTGSGTQGGSQKITIRGASSITGNNNPLFVIDGIPVSNDGRGSSPNGGYDYGSAVNDLNPDDIESMTVLKGPNAAALYGSRATNGAIIITTKKARAGQVSTEAAMTYTWEKPSILPDYQNRYGQGNLGKFNFVNGAGGGVNDGEDASWGPRLDVGTMACQFNSPRDDAGNCVAQPLVSHPDNVESFFEMGHTVATTLAVSGGTDRARARLSVGMDNTDGYIPNNTFKKFSGLLSGTVNVTDRLTTGATLQYARNSARNRPGVGYNVGILEQFIWFGRQVDVDALRNFNEPGSVNGGPASSPYNWNYNYHNNPYWLQYANPQEDTRDRFIGNVTANYQVTDWLNATARTGSDIYSFNIDRRFAAGNINYADPAYNGGFYDLDDYSNSNNSMVQLRAEGNVAPRIQVNAILGGAQQRDRFRTSSVTTSGISAPGIYNVSNAAITPTLDQNLEKRQVNSVYGSTAVTWDGWWTVEVTGRNDRSSTLPKGNNSYFYPSYSTSIVLTEALPALRNTVLSFAKIRGSVARVGSDASPYSLRSTYSGVSSQFGGLPQFTLGNVLSNADLKPEITTANEVGLEVELLGGRAVFDATYYNKATRDQIFNIAISSTTGFSSKTINAGKMENRGFEALLSVTPVQLDNGFSWRSTFNYAQNRNKLVELVDDLEAISLGSSWYTNIQARKGEPYGSIYGNAFARDSMNTGKPLTKNGLWVLDPTPKVLGNIQPDWTGGWSNQFNYRNVSLNMLFDFRVGGDIVSVTNFFGDYAGITEASLKGRENDWDDGIVIDGIDVATGAPNTVSITAQKYQQSKFPIMEPYVYDATWVKLREVRLGYTLPQAWANRIAATNLSIAVTGRNLWTSTDVPNIDPEFAYTTGNFQGIEFAALPNPRTFGLSVNITP